MTVLRWVDAVSAWLALAFVGWLAAPEASARTLGILALAGLGIGALVTPVRARWRPVSAVVYVATSAPLRAGDRAWYIRAGDAEPVAVTARRGLRLVIAALGQGGAEGISVRRTRVLVVPAEER